MPSMVEPRVVPRAEHTISRRDIDPDALKVLYRLRQFEHTAYLVGGSVRDLLIGRRPKDFDIGTSAHPYQVKKLFRNCWIIGRRFRLAHVKFGQKVIEVATFRRQVAPGEEVVEDGVPAPVITHIPNRRRRQPVRDIRVAGGDGRQRTGAATAERPSDSSRQHVRHAGRGRVSARLHDQRALLRHRDLLDHRLRRRPRGSAGGHRPLDRRSRGALSGGSGAHDAGGRAGGAARFHDRSAEPRRHPHPSPRDRAELRAALLEESTRFCAPARRRRTFRELAQAWDCSSRSPRSCIAAPPSRSGESLAALDAYRRSSTRRRTP